MSSPLDVELISSSEEDTRAIARALGAVLVPGDVVALTGDLGAGKTVFCKGLGEALGIAPERIVSPSFTIVTEHAGRMPLRHVDVYRIASAREAEEIGLEELLRGDGVCVVEWAEKVVNLLPSERIQVTFLFSEEGGDRRRLSVSAGDSPRFHEFLSRCRPFTTGG
ncbi:MAG: tRNA (adenosine(37)-N6)-threonylcarbamoyltransferase complex ATPase subunit type 1 TsaE [Deltaproteobacteria bacterium]